MDLKIMSKIGAINFKLFATHWDQISFIFINSRRNLSDEIIANQF
jgi:hypothetical protein